MFQSLVGIYTQLNDFKSFALLRDFQEINYPRTWGEYPLPIQHLGLARDFASATANDNQSKALLCIPKEKVGYFWKSLTKE